MRSGVSRVMPRVETCCGVVRASIRTLASAAVLAAESQPSTSKAPSASVIPISRARGKPVLERAAALHGFDHDLGRRIEHAREAQHLHARHRMPPQVEDRRAVHDRRFEAEAHARPRRLVAQSGIGMRDRSLVRRHHVHAARERRADMRDRRLAVVRVERRQLDRDLRPRRIQKLFDGRCARTERRLQGQPFGIDRRPVPQRVNAADRKRKFPPLLPQKNRASARPTFP